MVVTHKKQTTEEEEEDEEDEEETPIAKIRRLEKELDEAKATCNEQAVQLFVSNSNPLRGLSVASTLMSDVQKMRVYRNFDPVFLVSLDLLSWKTVNIPASYIEYLMALTANRSPKHINGRIIPFPRRHNMWDTLDLVSNLQKELGFCMPVFEYAFAVYMDDKRCTELRKFMIRHLASKIFGSDVGIIISGFIFSYT